ncbi:glucosidase 2 subunit beta precursor [Cucurbitaria berberidis CBS 394.84]|uniref:Glucosidase 2 subunit beta n=1 Tax=Cucurbitaria berberidis CBS 394.84 TaxID=1168544 RepID=A0A9P4GBT1_9PLEO|nr:glucosidase 2 subunit beta precursor [Cucurbitaria berberidis CBS 394.84]KAF1842624.1 glucosidase 2 subunit beta precursor [Cucurbitaria berberidis CBS 394.84]
MGRRHISSLALLLPVLASTANAASDPPRPRGVGPEFAKFYKDAETFACISNPSIKLSISRLNDDYCDCPDGSDEPGTSACSYLSPLSPSQPSNFQGSNLDTTLALPGFYCKNKGHQPSYIPFTNVNDGVCDYELCCDGSDEYERVGGVKCEDQCAKIGKEWRKQDEARQKSLNAARQRRKELIAESGRLRKEVEDRILTLKTQIEGQNLKVDGLTKSLAEIERQERGKVVKGAGKGGKITVLASLAKERIQELTDNVHRVRIERDTNRGRVEELEAMLRRFKEEYNPNFNDEGVKRAVKAWEDYAAQERPGPNEALDRDLDEILQPDSESAINWEEFETVDETDVDVLYKFEEYLPTPVRDWVDAKLRDLRVVLIENGILADPKTSDTPESKAVTDARSQLDSAKKELDDDKSELTKHEDDLTKDYGPDSIFRALKDRCVETDSGEYTYEHCFLASTTQKSKKGGGHTGMGNFARIEVVSVDEELPADGRGLGSGERIALKYENGQHCWNGPNRSTQVILACAEKDEIWKIVEEEKCVYRMEMGTPAVCGVDVKKSVVPEHNEL